MRDGVEGRRKLGFLRVEEEEENMVALFRTAAVIITFLDSEASRVDL